MTQKLKLPKFRYQNPSLVIFMLIFAGIGAYVIHRSFAASTCDLNATTSNFVSQISVATPGQTVCLASGDYSSFTGTSKSAPGITITAAPGATVTFNSGFNLNLASVQNFTLDGTAGGGTMTVGAAESDFETPGDAIQDKALNITFQNMTFAGGSQILLGGPQNSHITFNRDVFVDGNANAACSVKGMQILTDYSTSTPTTPSGITIKNSVFVAPTDLWNPFRAIQTAAPITVQNNVFTGYLDHHGASCNHIDNLQVFSGFNAQNSGGTFTGNLCYDSYGCYLAFDGTGSNTITDNACFDMERSCITLYADNGSTVDHNTMQTGGADPGGCNTQLGTIAGGIVDPCNAGVLFENGHKTGNTVSSNEAFTNNASRGGPNLGDASGVTTNTHNLWPTASSPNIPGSPTFAGGANPTTWLGFLLTAGSIGHLAGTDGLDVGIRASAGGPPTGGGSAPVNTAAPVVSGTPVQGQALTTTNGSWTITGNVPTATTYQWFDCPTATFSAASCEPIEAEISPTSTNDLTYTLQASDAGKYVFAEVTMTNASGQVNAISNVAGSGPALVTGDLNNDGHVNIFDLSIFLSHWQQSGTGLPEDFNNDGIVNIFDLSILLGHYGT